MNASLLAFAATSTFGVMAYGFLLGLRHATEADHLVAVSAVISERKGILKSALIGAVWGLGHTISLFVAGIFVLLLNFEISPRTENILELCVGIMLALLGLNVIRKLAQGGQLHFHTHEHGEHLHAHPHIHEPDEVHDPKTPHRSSFSPRSLFIGIVHGMAGSAALMLLVIPTIGSRMLGLVYIAVFGIGSIAGMALMTLFVGLPFYFTATRFTRLNYLLQGLAGMAGIILGLWIIYDRAFA
jgi:ABC-type nickel/cobalt efflux system permease component RcnA